MARARTTSAKAVVTAEDRQTKSVTAAATVTHGDVARRAYDLYLARDRAHGHDVEDWLQAERELRAAV